MKATQEETALCFQLPTGNNNKISSSTHVAECVASCDQIFTLYT